MPIQKEKVQSRKRYVCGQQTNFSAVILLNKIMTPIFQIIHIQKKKKLSTVERKRHIQTRVQRLCAFWHLKRSLGSEVVWGQNWTKESCDNAARWKLSPRKLPPMKIASSENTHLWKFPLWKFPPLEMAPLKIDPRKLTPRKFPPMKIATIVVRNWMLLPCCGGHGFRGRTGTYLIWYR